MIHSLLRSRVAFVSFEQRECFLRTPRDDICYRQGIKHCVPTSDVVAEIAAICCTDVAPAPGLIIRRSVETEPSIRRLERDETVSACGGESRKLIPANSQNGLKLPLARRMYAAVINLTRGPTMTSVTSVTM